MDRIRYAAVTCVGRAVAFGGFAISIVMLGSAFDFTLALRIGFTMTLVLTAVLLWYHQTAPFRRPEHFEAWLLIPVDERPHSDAARSVFRQVMAETYLYFAIRAFAAAVLMMMLWASLAFSGAQVGI